MSEQLRVNESVIRHVLAEFYADVKRDENRLLVRTPDGAMNDTLRMFIRAHKQNILSFTPDETQHQAPSN